MQAGNIRILSNTTGVGLTGFPALHTASPTGNWRGITSSYSRAWGPWPGTLFKQKKTSFNLASRRIFCARYLTQGIPDRSIHEPIPPCPHLRRMQPWRSRWFVLSERKQAALMARMSTLTRARRAAAWRRRQNTIRNPSDPQSPCGAGSYSTWRYDTQPKSEVPSSTSQRRS